MTKTENDNQGSHDDLPTDAAEQLVAYEEAKAEGNSGSIPASSVEPELRERLAKSLSCVDLLHRVWPDDEQAAPVSSEELKSKVLGDFRIIREIGRGGMGVVYEVEQLSLQRPMALKLLPLAGILDEQVLKRFKNEALAAATLDHPNIVQVHSVGCDRGVHYYAMQLIEGQTLAQTITELRRIREHRFGDQADEITDVSYLSAAIAAGRLESQANEDDGQQSKNPIIAPPNEDTNREVQAAVSTIPSLETRTYFRTVANLGIQAAEALDHAHTNGILHRDIKPGNLMIDGNGNLWVTDFGLARIEASAPMTMTGDMLGTLRYMCPEMAAGRRERLVVDHRTDIYSLGVTLYELLTLQPAFEGNDRKELFKKIILEEPRPPRRISKNIPANLETIVLKAMRKDPTNRYATASELAEDLKHFLDDEPIRAKPPTLVERSRMWSRRNRTVVSAAAMLLMVVTIGSLIATGLIWQEQVRTANALQESRDNEMKAELKVAESKAVVDFLINKLLGSAAPNQSKDDPVTVNEVLTNAEANIETAFLDQPLVEASVRHAMGVAYSALSQYQDAERHLEKAWKLRIQWLGESHADTLYTMDSLSGVLHNLGRLEEAVETYEKLIELSKIARGREHHATLVAMEGLATVLAEKGNLQEAKAHLKQALEIRRDVFQPDDRSLAAPMQNLAMVLFHLGELVEAREHIESSLSLQKFPPEHPTNLILLNCLAMILDSQGEKDQAKIRYREVLELRKNVLPPGHHDTLISMVNLGALLLDDGQYDQARPLFEDAVKGLEKKFPAKTHPHTLMSKFNLAIVLTKQGEFSKAHEIFDEVIDGRSKILSLDHSDTLSAMEGLAWLLYEQAKFDEAGSLYEKILNIKSGKWGPDDPQTLRAIGDRAWVLTRLGQSERARRLADKALARLLKINGSRHVDTLNMQNTLAESLLGLGEISKAREVREEVVQFGDVPDYMPIDRATWLKDLARTISLKENTTLEDQERAIELAKKAIELMPQEYDSHRVLGISCAVSNHLRQALEAFNKAIELGYAGELVPSTVLQRIDNTENQSDEHFQRLMKLVRERAKEPAP